MCSFFLELVTKIRNLSILDSWFEEFTIPSLHDIVANFKIRCYWASSKLLNNSWAEQSLLDQLIDTFMWPVAELKKKREREREREEQQEYDLLLAACKTQLQMRTARLLGWDDIILACQE